MCISVRSFVLDYDFRGEIPSGWIRSFPEWWTGVLILCASDLSGRAGAAHSHRMDGNTGRRIYTNPTVKSRMAACLTMPRLLHMRGRTSFTAASGGNEGASPGQKGL